MTSQTSENTSETPCINPKDKLLVVKLYSISNYIKGKFCVYVCVSVRYRTSLNVVGMGLKLLGVIRRTLRWSSTGKMFKKLI
jgi:hypothetical protein